MLSEKIKELRVSKGLSQQEFAGKLSVVRQTVSKWEKGLSLPDSEMLVHIAEVLDVTVSELVGEEITELAKETPSNTDKPSKALPLTLIILGSPLWFPLLIAALSVVFSLFVALWSGIVSFWAVFASFVGVAVGFLLGGGILSFFENALSGTFLIGLALISAGLSVFSFFGCKAATKSSVWLTKKIFFAIVGIFTKKGGAIE